MNLFESTPARMRFLAWMLEEAENAMLTQNDFDADDQEALDYWNSLVDAMKLGEQS